MVIIEINKLNLKIKFEKRQHNNHDDENAIF